MGAAHHVVLDRAVEVNGVPVPVVLVVAGPDPAVCLTQLERSRRVALGVDGLGLSQEGHQREHLCGRPSSPRPPGRTGRSPRPPAIRGRPPRRRRELWLKCGLAQRPQRRAGASGRASRLHRAAQHSGAATPCGGCRAVWPALASSRGMTTARCESSVAVLGSDLSDTVRATGPWTGVSCGCNWWFRAAACGCSAGSAVLVRRPGGGLPDACGRRQPAGVAVSSAHLGPRDGSPRAVRLACGAGHREHRCAAEGDRHVLPASAGTPGRVPGQDRPALGKGDGPT